MSNVSQVPAGLKAGGAEKLATGLEVPASSLPIQDLQQLLMALHSNAPGVGNITIHPPKVCGQGTPTTGLCGAITILPQMSLDVS